MEAFSDSFDVLHAALFKLKRDADVKKVQKWQQLAQGMVGKVPGKKSNPSEVVSLVAWFFFSPDRPLWSLKLY
jgi:hypothetical protein